MSMWYYADADHARQGPIDAAELVRLRLQGRLAWDTLVWREGMTDWQPMRDFASELAQADDRAPALAETAAPGAAGATVPPAGAAPATEPALPAEIGSVEELFLVGRHLEQYRHHHVQRFETGNDLAYHFRHHLHRHLCGHQIYFYHDDFHYRQSHLTCFRFWNAGIAGRCHFRQRSPDPL